jgi:hypothetical protein
MCRHNGVVIEPTGTEKKGIVENEPEASGSKSKSRSSSPSSKDKENPAPDTAAPGSLGGPQGPHSYYRQHTMPHAGGKSAYSRTNSLLKSL